MAATKSSQSQKSLAFLERCLWVAVMERNACEATAAMALLLFADQVSNDRKREREQTLRDRSARLRSAKVKVRKEGSRQRLSKMSQAILIAWLEAHYDNPYPSNQEKGELAREAGLTVKQVSNFAGNWRKRTWNAPADMDGVSDEEDDDEGVTFGLEELIE
jgi:hypothetical protein